MKRGFKVTLMTVATAMLGLQAMAMAPVIGNVPSPIVGGKVTATGTTPFVYGDALDLNSYVTDDTTAATDIKWSYAITGTPKYAINGVDPINVSTEDPTTPGAKQINSQVLKSETNADGKTNTITIRNINLSPFTGTGATPSGSGIIDSQAVTLFASDGTTYSSKSLLFYSDNGGQSRLSPGQASWTPIASPNFKTGTQGWTFANVVGASSSSGANGICLSTTTNLKDIAMGQWNSAFGLLPLTDNTVYRIRADLNYTQFTGATKVPFWDVIINNYGTAGFNLFGGDCYFMDNTGSANAIGTSTTKFEMYWCPMPIQIPAWKSTVFTAANDANNDAFLQFRILDVAAGTGAEQSAGTICMSGLTLEKIDFSALTQASALTQVYTQTNFTAANTTSNLLLTGTAAGGITYSGGAVTLSPKVAGTLGNGQDVEYGTVVPGDANFDVANPSSIPDNFPITMEANTLYMITATLSAPDALSETNPLDVFWLAMDSPTNEVIAESYVTGALGRVAMPKQGTPQTYTSFYFSGKGSNTTITNGKSLRPKLAVGNNGGLVFNTNTGSIRLNSMKVDKVAIPQ